MAVEALENDEIANPLDRVELEANRSFWKPGQPYMDAITMKVMTDEQSPIARSRSEIFLRRHASRSASIR